MFYFVIDVDKEVIKFEFELGLVFFERIIKY